MKERVTTAMTGGTKRNTALGRVEALRTQPGLPQPHEKGWRKELQTDGTSAGESPCDEETDRATARKTRDAGHRIQEVCEEV